MISKVWFSVPNILSILYFPEYVFRNWRRNAFAYELKTHKIEDICFGQDLVFTTLALRMCKLIPDKK